MSHNLTSYLLYHPHLPAVAAGAHGEVQPVAASLVALQQQLVEVLLRLVADVQQDGGIADELFQSADAVVRLVIHLLCMIRLMSSSDRCSTCFCQILQCLHRDWQAVVE